MTHKTLIRILLVHSREKAYSGLLRAFQDKGCLISRAPDGEAAVALIKETGFDLVVADETLADMTGLAFAEKLVVANPMQNYALVSSLSSADFHEASEGLGVLMQIPPAPDSKDAEKILECIEKVNQLTNRKSP